MSVSLLFVYEALVDGLVGAKRGSVEPKPQERLDEGSGREETRM
jgi:hypothetical protein